MLKNNKIGVLCNYPFPEGMAPSTRIVSYCKGLKANGIQAEIFSAYWLSDNSPFPIEGNSGGIHYKISNAYHANRGYLYKNIVDRIRIQYNSIIDICRSHKEKPFDYIIVSMDSPLLLFRYVPLLRLLGFKLINILDEYPASIRKLKNSVPKRTLIAYRIIHRLFSGRILMTESLKSFYNTQIGQKPSYILDSVVDEDRFASVTRQAVERPFLCYMGNMDLAKDNVDNIIEAFSLIADKYPEYDLHLYGIPSKVNEKKLLDLISKHRLESRVFLMGRANYGDVPQVLANASVLLASQPKTKRAEGGFPTKMAEYMLSMTPMLLTDVGEISNYVSDSQDAFLVEACNAKEYAKKIDYILSNPSEAEKVAKNAKQHALLCFASKQATAGLVDFLKSL